MTGHPRLLQPVIDCVDPRRLAEFYRKLLGYTYRQGDEPPTDGPDDVDWLVLLKPSGERGLAFQHLDMTVEDRVALDAQHERVIGLGATLVLDRSDDLHEPLRVFTDPAGHPFCLIVG